MRRELVETVKFMGYCVGMLVMLPAGFVYKASAMLVHWCADFDKDHLN